MVQQPLQVLGVQLPQYANIADWYSLECYLKQWYITGTHVNGEVGSIPAVRTNEIFIRGVAQDGRVTVSDTASHRFDSCRPCHLV